MAASEYDPDEIIIQLITSFISGQAIIYYGDPTSTTATTTTGGKPAESIPPTTNTTTKSPNSLSVPTSTSPSRSPATSVPQSSQASLTTTSSAVLTSPTTIAPTVTSTAATTGWRSSTSVVTRPGETGASVENYGEQGPFPESEPISTIPSNGGGIRYPIPTGETESKSSSDLEVAPLVETSSDQGLQADTGSAVLRPGHIAAIVIGSILLLICIFLFLAWMLRRRFHPRSKDSLSGSQTAMEVGGPDVSNGRDRDCVVSEGLGRVELAVSGTEILEKDGRSIYEMEGSKTTHELVFKY